MQTQFSQAEKEMILLEVREVGNRSLVARKHGVSETTIRNWEGKIKPRKEPETKEEMVQEIRILRERVKKQDLEIMILKDLAKK